MWLQAILGLKINFGKFELVPTSSVKCGCLVRYFGVQSIQASYDIFGASLRLHLQGERAMSNVVIEKLERGFAALKRMHLSIGAE